MMGLGEKAKLFPFSHFPSHYSPLALLACVGLRKLVEQAGIYEPFCVGCQSSLLDARSIKGNLFFAIPVEDIRFMEHTSTSKRQ